MAPGVLCPLPLTLEFIDALVLLLAVLLGALLALREDLVNPLIELKNDIFVGGSRPFV